MFGFLIGILRRIENEQKRDEIKELRQKLDHFENISSKEFLLLKKYSSDPTPVFHVSYEAYLEDCKRTPEERAAFSKKMDDYFNTPEGREMFDKMTGGHLKGWGEKK